MLFDGEGIAIEALPPLEVSAPVVDAPANEPPDPSYAIETRDLLDTLVDEDGFSRETGTKHGEPVLLAEKASADLTWALQLASFSQSERATELRDRLRTDGYNAFMSRHKSGDTVSTRVAIGPFVERQHAADLKQQLDERYDVASTVVHCSP